MSVQNAEAPWKGTFGHLLKTTSAEAASSCETFGAPKHDPNNVVSNISYASSFINTYIVMMKVRPSSPSSEDHYILREMMLRRMKDY
jgi:hypothetical protein